jgi:hypothetical protein
MALRTAGEIAAKWSSVTPTRSGYYESGVKSPKKDWAAATAGSETTYKDAVTKAASEGRFGKGVRRAGSEKWQRKAVDIGASRWGPGVSAAAQDYESGFTPYRDALDKISYKPRYPKGDPRNYDRTKQVGDALHTLKLSR